MLSQASVGELKRGVIAKALGHVVLVMRFYPRGLARSQIHEYERSLAPSAELFNDFREKIAEGLSHNAAFEAVCYESRFQVGYDGLAQLARLCEMARSKEVFLVCQCEKNERCHRHLLLRMGARLFGAETERVRLDYPIFESRDDWPRQLKSGNSKL